jgi:4'-phosphopantetheinyl transferase
MKEAYLKAWGTGLSFASNRFTLDYVGDGAGRLVSTDMPGDDPDEWRFEDVPLGGGYTGAICFEGVKRPLRRWAA